MLRHLLRPVVLTAALGLSPLPLMAQAAGSASTSPATSRILGTVVALGSGAITVKQEGASTAEITVAITPDTRLLRITPGETNLKNATPLALADLAVGDRVLIRAAGDSSSEHPTAATLIAMKQGDISHAHEQESAAWQKLGVAGIVESVDPATGAIRIRQGGGAPALTVDTTAATVVRRYSPDSTAFADTHKATLADVHPGDQLRARGEKPAEDGQVKADEIVAGSFRNIAGTVDSTDPGANTITLTDLSTKRNLTLHLEPATQLRRLPPEMAARMAHRAGGDTGGTPAAGAPRAEGAPAQHRGGDIAAMLQHAPTINLAELKKGDAVMIVASAPDAKQQTAITLIAGVEPLLQGSSEASSSLFSASWNLGGGGETGGADAPQR